MFMPESSLTVVFYEYNPAEADLSVDQRTLCGAVPLRLVSPFRGSWAASTTGLTRVHPRREASRS